MEPTYSVEVRPPFVVVTAAGRFDLDSWLEVLDGLVEAPGFEPDLHTLVDAREASFDFKYPDAHALLGRLREYMKQRGRDYRAAYVIGTDADYGVARMVQTVLGELPLTAATFRTVDEAEAWLVGEDEGAE